MESIPGEQVAPRFLKFQQQPSKLCTYFSWQSLNCPDITCLVSSYIHLHMTILGKWLTKKRNLAKWSSTVQLTRNGSCIWKQKENPPCRAALRANDWGNSFQLNSRRDSLPPLHQNKLKPLPAFEDGFTSGSKCLAFFLPIPCLTRDELIMIWCPEPILAKESTCFSQSGVSARGRKFDSNWHQSKIHTGKKRVKKSIQICNS